MYIMQLVVYITLQQETRIVKLKDIVSNMMAIAYDADKNILTSSPSMLPVSAVQIFDSILDLYVSTIMKSIILDDEDFDWLLDMINNCKHDRLLYVLLNYLKHILLIRDVGRHELGIFNSHVSEIVAKCNVLCHLHAQPSWDNIQFPLCYIQYFCVLFNIFADYLPFSFCFAYNSTKKDSNVSWELVQTIHTFLIFTRNAQMSRLKTKVFGR